MIIVSLNENKSITVEKPKAYISAGHAVCGWCERTIERDRWYLAQLQLDNRKRWHCARLCTTCSIEKRGSIVFKPFICALSRH